MNNTYYNEFDKQKCAILVQLMKDGHITKGDIDDRSIADVRPDDLKGYTRAHFFAGIGLWDHALNLAGWEKDRPVWTGSCPCQPFSAAGGQKGKDDDRHLWPEWLRLIKKHRPPEIFGEQVANAITKGWLDDVYQGLEEENYAVGSIVLPASAVGAPHRRERLWIVANSQCNGHTSNKITGGQGEAGKREQEGQNNTINAAGASRSFDVADTRSIGREKRRRADTEYDRVIPISNSEHNREGNVADSNSDRCHQGREGIATPRSDGFVGNGGSMGNTSGEGSQRHGRSEQEHGSEGRQNQERHPWSSGVWIDCPDGKQRLVEPTIPLLVDGDTERVGLIHAAGDAIVAQVASEVIKAAMYIGSK